MNTTRSRQGIAMASLVAVLALTPTDAAPAGSSPTWWDRLFEVFTPAPAPPVAVASPSAPPDATPKNRCHIIIGGVVQEYECD